MELLDESGMHAAERYAREWIDLLKEIIQCLRIATQAQPKQVNRFQQDRTTPGSAANETTDGLDATAEALRHAAEDTPSGAKPDDVEKTPVFDRAGQAPKI